MDKYRINGEVVASFTAFIEASNGYDMAEKTAAWLRDMKPGRSALLTHRHHGFAILSYGRPGARLEFVAKHVARVADCLKCAGRGINEGRSITDDLDDALHHAVQADMPDLRALIVGALGEATGE